MSKWQRIELAIVTLGMSMVIVTAIVRLIQEV